MISSVRPTVLQRAAERVHVGGVEEGDALGDRGIQDRVRGLLVALQAEGHRAEAEAGNLQSGAAKANMLHRYEPSLASRGWEAGPVGVSGVTARAVNRKYGGREERRVTARVEWSALHHGICHTGLGEIAVEKSVLFGILGIGTHSIPSLRYDAR